jgi:Cdc6-like AAA superfamily ATPase
VTETAVGGKLRLSLDVQRRKARGKANSLRAKKVVLEQDLGIFLDTLRVQAEASLSALRAQHEVTELNQAATSFAQQVTDAEAESLQLGQSSVLAVNLREQAQASAFLSELESLFEFHLAWIELQRVLGKQEIADYLPPRAEQADSKLAPVDLP